MQGKQLENGNLRRLNNKSTRYLFCPAVSGLSKMVMKAVSVALAAMFLFLVFAGCVGDKQEQSTNNSKNTTQNDPNQLLRNGNFSNASHKWVLFVAVCNSNYGGRLGNGDLYLAENFTKYLIQSCNFSAKRCTILYDDGNYSTNGTGGGGGEDMRTGITKSPYGGATYENVKRELGKISNESNLYGDSEVLIMICGHGNNGVLSNQEHALSSTVGLWDASLWDYDLAEMVKELNASKVWIHIGACQAGGFANKLIFGIDNINNGNLPHKGWIISTASSVITLGWVLNNNDANGTQRRYGNMILCDMFFTMRDNIADGYGELALGQSLSIGEKDGKTSVEEAFWYAQCATSVGDLGTEPLLIASRIESQPQINDQYDGDFFL
jgi:hypothetical protein